MNWICSLLLLFVYSRSTCGQIRLVTCNPGHRISSISKKSTSGMIEYTAECKPLIQEPNRITDVTCSFGNADNCNGSLAGCKEHPDAWLGGVKIVPYQPDGSVDVIIPLCCNASNVLVRGNTCRYMRMNTQTRNPRLIVEADEVIQGLSCRVLRTLDDRIYDVTLRMRVCRFEIEKQCCNKYMIGYFLHNFFKPRDA